MINTAAIRTARTLFDERERPDAESDDLFDRAVCGHYRQLQEAAIVASQGQLAEWRMVLNDGG